MPYTFTGDPIVGGARRVVFISADDDGAKKEVETLLTGFGYSVIDLGNLSRWWVDSASRCPSRKTKFV
jgi:predicted dinucleotide-binding enzyme